jgi:hypothetical protein
MGQMADAAGPARGETAVTSARQPDRKALLMTRSARRAVSSSPSTPAAPKRSRRRIAAAALISLTLVGAAAPAAYAGPDTNIQKPGHIS